MTMDQDQLVRLLLRERARLTAYIWSIVHEPHLTEDVFQEVCLEAIHRRHTIRDVDHLLSWARRTARHRAINHIKQRNRQPLQLSEQAMSLLDSTWQADDDQSSDQLADALHHCLDTLTPRARRIVKLRYIDGLKGQAVADTMGQTLDAVYKALSRIHQQLVDCIADHRRRAASEVPHDRA